MAVFVRSFRRPMSGWHSAILSALCFVPLPLVIAVPVVVVAVFMIVLLRYLDERRDGGDTLRS